MPAFGVAVGLALGLLAGGRATNLPSVRLRWLPLILVAAIWRFGIDLWPSRPDGLTLAVVPAYAGLAVGFIANRRLPGMSAAAVGVIGNGVAIAMNLGRMPVWSPSLAAAGLPSDYVASASHVLLSGGLSREFLLRGGPLSDLIPIPPIATVVSIGDLLVAVGLGTFVFAATIREPSMFLTTEPTPPRALERHSFARLAANGSFSALWVAQLVSALGDRVHQIALVFLIARATDRPEIAVGMAFAASVIPNVLVGPLAGAIVDRADRKAVLIASDLGRAACAVSIPVAAAASAWLVLPIVFLVAALSTFFRPARTALLPALVDEDDLMAANSALWIGDTVTDTAGFAAAGLFVAFLADSLSIAFWMDAASYVASALLIAAISVTRADLVGERAVKSVMSEIAEGWRFLRNEIVLLTTTAQAVVAQSCGGAITALSPWLMASLATAAVAPEEAYGYLEAAIGVGAVGGGLLFAALGNRAPKGRTIGIAYVGLGAFSVLLATSPSVPAALCVGVAIGLANVAFVVPSQTLFQLRTPPEMMGRVIAIRLALVNAVLAVAMISSGFLAEAFGVSTVLIACGIVTMLAGVGGFFVKAIREA